MADEKKDSSLAEVLRAQLIELASKCETLTPEVLARIMRVAKTGRDLLVSLSASPASLAAMMKRPQFGIPLGEANLDGLGDNEVSGPMPLAYSPPPENFGMVAIREIIAAVKAATNGGESPEKLVLALAAARSAGLDDVAKEFEKRLGIGKKETQAKPATLEVKEGAQL